MKVGFICGRGIQAGIQTLRLSPKSRAGPLGETRPSARLKLRFGGPERWPGPLCVYCKVVAESRSRHAKKTATIR